MRCSVCPDLIDSVELERTVNRLNQELSVSREAEEALRAQLEELASDKVDDLMKQVSGANIFRARRRRRSVSSSFVTPRRLRCTS